MIDGSLESRVELLLSVIELLFLSLAVEALQGKRYQESLLSGGLGQFKRRFQGKGSSLVNIFWFLQLHRATCRRFDTIPACDRQTDRRNCRS